MVAPQPFYQDRGTPIALRHVLEAFSQLGVEADVLTFPVGDAVEIPGVRIIRIPNLLRIRHVPIGFSLQKVLLDVQMAFSLRRLLKRAKHEYVGIHAVEEAAFLATLLGRGLPVTYDMQSSLPDQLRKRAPFKWSWMQRPLRACERWLLNRADLVVCSAGLAEYVRKVAPAARVREWWFPVRFQRASTRDTVALRTELQIPDGAPVVVYSGTFEQYQGLSSLLQAIPAVREQVPGAVFVLVGQHGAAGDDIAREAKALGLVGNGVHLLPRQPRERISTFLALADVLVSPRSAGDNLPLKIYDYLAAGRPIVATDLPVHHPTLEEDRAALVSPSAISIADGIVQLLRDPVRARRMARSGRAYARDKLGQEVFVHSISELYHELVGSVRNVARA